MREICKLCGQSLPRNDGSLGSLIANQRHKMRFSLRDIERITDGAISNAYLSQLETGRVKEPSAMKLIILSHALSIDINFLLNAIDPTYMPHGGRNALP